MTKGGTFQSIQQILRNESVTIEMNPRRFRVIINIIPKRIVTHGNIVTGSTTKCYVRLISTKYLDAICEEVTTITDQMHLQ